MQTLNSRDLARVMDLIDKLLENHQKLDDRLDEMSERLAKITRLHVESDSDEGTPPPKKRRTNQLQVVGSSVSPTYLSDVLSDSSDDEFTRWDLWSSSPSPA